MNISILIATQDSLYAEWSKINNELRTYPADAMNRTLDSAKDARWHHLKSEQAKAFAAIRLFNKKHAKQIHKSQKGK